MQEILIGKLYVQQLVCLQVGNNFAVQYQCEIKDKTWFLEKLIHEVSLKILIMEEELKVLKDQESVKNTTVQIKYKEDLMETKMDSEHISLINYRKE